MSDAGGPPPTIEHLTGLALGRLGMSFDDFCRCTPGEFRAALEAFREESEARERAAWDRARFTAACILQPHTRRRLRPQDVARFPWDTAATDAPKVKSTRERFEALKKQWGG